MVSRSETARPLLTPGEVMQLPPTDEIVMVSGVHPIRAKKARYYEDERLQERIMAPPVLARPKEARLDDWSARLLPPRPPAPVAGDGEDADDEDPKNADRRKQLELSQDAVEKKEPIENEFALDPVDDMEEDAPRIGRMNDLMQGLAQQASLDPGDDLGM
jgi:type IV secretion system protein VirD4